MAMHSREEFLRY